MSISSSQPPKWTRGTPLDNENMSSPEDTPHSSVENLLQQKREARLNADKELPEPPEAKSPLKSPQKSLPDTEDEGPATPSTEEQTPDKSSTSLGLYILLSVCLCLLFVFAYIIKTQRDALPETDPYELAEQTYKQTYETHIKAKLKSLELEQNMLKAQKLQSSYNQLIKAKELIALQQDQKIALQAEIAGLKKEMLTYYKRYKSLTQKQARGIYLDHLVTRSGKEFSEVSIRECTPKQISIIHSEGSTRLSLSDLPDALLDRLAYSHPFTDLLTEKATDKAPKMGNSKATVVFGEDPAKRNMDPNEESLLPDLQSYDPPSKAPSVSSPTHLENANSPKSSLPSLEEARPMSDLPSPQGNKEGTELLRPSTPESAPVPELEVPDELELPAL